MSPHPIAHYLMPTLRGSASFISHCEREIWGRTASSENPNLHGRPVFLALFNAVLALGAITAGEDAFFMQGAPSGHSPTADILRRDPNGDAPIYPPLKLAKLFFERAKENLSDPFEACSFESTQTLFLMAVFCQNALKPHSCYMYSGMAARTALAIGIPSCVDHGSTQASSLWWGLYSHEIEMCASVGRESALREPHHYQVPLPQILPLESSCQALIGCMVALAQLLRELSHEVYQSNSTLTLTERSARSLSLDKRLMVWKDQLPPTLNLEKTSLVEPEWVSKQKIVLRLRFFNARILFHRPFLIAAATEENPEPYLTHVQLCVEVSRKTIELLYDAYVHRPYFRTWWYNATYTLYATMILLYVVLSNIQPGPEDDLLQDVEKSLEIFNAMNMIVVARRCAEITTEILEITRKLVQERREKERPPRQQESTAGDITGDVLPTVSDPTVHTLPGFGFDITHENLFDITREDLFASLVDCNLMDGFTDYGSGFVDGPDTDSAAASRNIPVINQGEGNFQTYRMGNDGVLGGAILRLDETAQDSYQRLTW
ncbi:hypothetical protein W97_00718 [Coniosporium apollinis CBS 100218]|uniref:Xylanolytic transcriptional activator regulatory domain-containing protein n=1 Tax=Coniosporium apollinis (strain CBS 100218) TaxID=1168221 RepID=R7YHZ2_CONA1|nr:uncharacterized protein W97_00718 [Coniosporium apollinis CBS 100218]EON61503.1 hypothetical protein W97_00718 [Coniosporium apollinis CBS 100218]